MGSPPSSDGFREVPCSFVVGLPRSQMAAAFRCPSCTFELQLLCNRSWFHSLNIFLVPPGCYIPCWTLLKQK